MLHFPIKVDLKLRSFIWNEHKKWSLEIRSYDSDIAWRVLETFDAEPSNEVISKYRDLIEKVLASYLDGVKVLPTLPFSFQNEDDGEIKDIQISPECSQTSDPVINQVIQKLSDRSERGQIKYGTTLARGDLTTKEWMNHLQEELMDGAGYLQVLINKS